MGASAVSTDDSGASVTTADIYPEADLLRLQSAVRVLLSGVGEDISREGLRDTPKVQCYRCWSCTHRCICQYVAEFVFVAEGCQSLGGCFQWLQTGPAQVAICCIVTILHYLLLKQPIAPD